MCLYAFDQKLQNIVHYLVTVKLEKQLMTRFPVNAEIYVAAVRKILRDSAANAVSVFADGIHSAAQEQHGQIDGGILDNRLAVRAEKRVQQIAESRDGKREIALGIGGVFVDVSVVAREPVVRGAAVRRAEIE